MSKLSGIYKIVCKNNNKFYIGSSIDINRRLKTHISLLKHNKHTNEYLQRAWNKYSEQNFRYEIIETVHDNSQLQIREKWWLDHTKCYNQEIGFNLSVDPVAPMTGRFLDLIGQKFGRLTTIKPNGKDKWGSLLWECLCDCGKQKTINGNLLRRGITKSCGCLNKELASKRSIKHGLTKTKIYMIWTQINQRCNNRNHPRYKDYGGRIPPITVCYRWSNKNPHGFENFYKDVGDPPKNKSLCRMNNGKGYCANNWKWSTTKEQNNNRRNKINSKLYKYNNKKLYLFELSKKYKIHPATLWYRINKLKWPTKDAITKPIQKHKRKIK